MSVILYCMDLDLGKLLFPRFWLDYTKIFNRFIQLKNTEEEDQVYEALQKVSSFSYSTSQYPNLGFSTLEIVPCFEVL